MLQLEQTLSMNSKRTTIIFLSVLLLIVLGLAFVITQSFLKPFAFAIILAVVFYPLHERILRWNKGRPAGSALLSTLLLILLFGVPSFIIAVLAANEALSAAHYLSRRSVEEGGFPSLVMTLANGPIHYIGHWVDLSKYDLQAMVSANAQKVSVWLVGFGANVLEWHRSLRHRRADHVRGRFLSVSRRSAMGLSGRRGAPAFS